MSRAPIKTSEGVRINVAEGSEMGLTTRKKIDRSAVCTTQRLPYIIQAKVQASVVLKLSHSSRSLSLLCSQFLCNSPLHSSRSGSAETSIRSIGRRNNVVAYSQIKVNVNVPTAQLDLVTQKSNVGAHKINGLALVTYGMVSRFLDLRLAGEDSIL